MSTTVADRQYELYALIDMTLANRGAGNGYDISVPPGSAVLGMSVAILDPFDGTTASLAVTDNATPPNAIATIDLKGAIGVFPAVPIVPKVYPSGARFDFTITATGTQTKGRAIGTLRYVTLGRSNEVMT